MLTHSFSKYYGASTHLLCAKSCSRPWGHRRASFSACVLRRLTFKWGEEKINKKEDKQRVEPGVKATLPQLVLGVGVLQRLALISWMALYLSRRGHSIPHLCYRVSLVVTVAYLQSSTGTSRALAICTLLSSAAFSFTQGALETATSNRGILENLSVWISPKSAFLDHSKCLMWNISFSIQNNPVRCIYGHLNWQVNNPSHREDKQFLQIHTTTKWFWAQ